MANSKGILIPPSADLAFIVRALQGRLGEINMQPGGLGLGVFDAVVATKVLATGDDGSGGVALPHTLGRVPGSVVLLELVLAPGQDAVISVASKSKALWTATQVQIRIGTVAGNVNGVLARFLVGG